MCGLQCVMLELKPFLSGGDRMQVDPQAAASAASSAASSLGSAAAAAAGTAAAAAAAAGEVDNLGTQ